MASLEVTDDYVKALRSGEVTCTVCGFAEVEDGPFTTNHDKWGPFQLAQEHAREHGKSTQADSFQGGVRFYIMVAA